MSKPYRSTLTIPARTDLRDRLVDFAVSGSKALLIVAEHDGPAMFARIGIMQAVNRLHVREFDLDRKPHHWGKRKLKRDQ